MRAGGDRPLLARIGGRSRTGADTSGLRSGGRERARPFDVGTIARNVGALMLVDAAQSAGHLPISLRELPVDLLAGSGHKGLLGPLGTGWLAIRAGVEEHVTSLRQGGTGSLSEDHRQPDRLPDKYESGNHNAPGLFGLEAALAWLQDRGLDVIRSHELSLRRLLLDQLAG